MLGEEFEYEPARVIERIKITSVSITNRPIFGGASNSVIDEDIIYGAIGYTETNGVGNEKKK